MLRKPPLFLEVAQLSIQSMNKYVYKNIRLYMKNETAVYGNISAVLKNQHQVKKYRLDSRLFY